jgi:hypothetical protein
MLDVVPNLAIAIGADMITLPLNPACINPENESLVKAVVRWSGLADTRVDSPSAYLVRVQPVQRSTAFLRLESAFTKGFLLRRKQNPVFQNAKPWPCLALTTKSQQAANADDSDQMDTGFRLTPDGDRRVPISPLVIFALLAWREGWSPSCWG